MNAAITLAQEAVESMTRLTAIDIVLLKAHKSIENYYAARYFEDEDEMVESISAIEWFFQLVQKSKSQYSIIQLAMALHYLQTGSRPGAAPWCFLSYA